MQEALNVHFRGKSFRERHAGLEIDAHMTSEGFNVNIGIDMETGINELTRVWSPSLKQLKYLHYIVILFRFRLWRK